MWIRRAALFLIVCLGLTGCGGGGSGGGGQGNQIASPVPPTLPLLTALSRNGPITMMPLGDSITYGYADPSGDGYRKRLWDDLTDAGFTISYRGSLNNGSTDLPDTRNEGHGGYRIDQIASGIDNWLKNTQPQIVLLMIGTNDIIQADQMSAAPDRLSALIERILQDDPQAHLLVASLPPISAGGVFEPGVDAYNARIPALVQAKAAQGEPVTYVDVHNALTPSDLIDGVHPTPSGYAKIGDAWFQALHGP